MPLRVLSCDPGLANTGLVMFDGRRIVKVATLRSPALSTRPEFGPCVERVEKMAADLAEAVAKMGACPDVVVCEAYRDIPGRLRQAANRWTTPLAIGLLIPALRSLTEGGAIVWQDPERVMTAYAQAVRLWALGQHGIVTGDELLRNEHVRSAAAHGCFYLEAHRRAAS
jgi:hypothetical protein